MVKIAPSILSADFARLGEEVQKATQAGADLIHFDVMDGHFVPNLTIGPQVVADLRKYTHLTFDVHFMIESPEKYVEAFADTGADQITVHIEACSENADYVISLIKQKNLKAGLALRPDTPASAVFPYLSMIDLLLPMTVNPGSGGQEFMPEVVPKIYELSERASDEVEIGVDGGINVKTAPIVARAGANIFIAGTAIFKDPSGIQKAIQALRDAAKN